MFAYQFRSASLSTAPCLEECTCQRQQPFWLPSYEMARRPVRRLSWQHHTMNNPWKFKWHRTDRPVNNFLKAEGPVPVNHSNWQLHMQYLTSTSWQLINRFISKQPFLGSCSCHLKNDRRRCVLDDNIQTSGLNVPTWVMGCLCLGEMQGDVLGGEELLEEGLDEAEAESDPAQVPGVAALLLHGVVLDVLVEDVAQGAVWLARADEVVHLDGWMDGWLMNVQYSAGKTRLHFLTGPFLTANRVREQFCFFTNERRPLNRKRVCTQSTVSQINAATFLPGAFLKEEKR